MYLQHNTSPACSKTVRCTDVLFDLSLSAMLDEALFVCCSERQPNSTEKKPKLTTRQTSKARNGVQGAQHNSAA